MVAPYIFCKDKGNSNWVTNVTNVIYALGVRLHNYTTVWTVYYSGSDMERKIHYMTVMGKLVPLENKLQAQFPETKVEICKKRSCSCMTEKVSVQTQALDFMHMLVALFLHVKAIIWALSNIFCIEYVHCCYQLYVYLLFSSLTLQALVFLWWQDTVI